MQRVRQVLDSDGNVVMQLQPEVQNDLRDMSAALATVRKGMRAVVNGGTGRAAGLSYINNAGKTGTAQWGRPQDDCRLAWFAGFLPSENPRYAYAALYEGRPHQRISGGRMAGAIVKAFFESIKDEMKNAIANPDAETKAKLIFDPLSGEAIEETEEQQATTERQERQREQRNSRQGWRDGRSRN